MLAKSKSFQFFSIKIDFQNDQSSSIHKRLAFWDRKAIK
eukprot:UN12423